MRRAWRIMMVAVFIAAGMVNAAERFDFAQLAFLEGTWVGQQAGLQMEEHWTSASGDGLVGMHKDVKSSAMVGFEFLRIATAQDGKVTYFSSPSGAPVTAFRLQRSEHHRVVFENPEHDFPQRIIYWLEPDGRLGARIEGEIGGKAEAQEWRWERKR